MAIGIGDLTLAYQCLKIAISIDPTHAEAYNNLGVLEYRKGSDEQARSFFRCGGCGLTGAGQGGGEQARPFFRCGLGGGEPAGFPKGASSGASWREGEGE